jgi:nucleotide-binding universal stress UspA family protein
MSGVVVVGYEGSERSSDALALAETLAATEDARLIVAVAHAGSGGEAESAASAALSALSRPNEATVALSASTGLAEVAEQHGATMLVLGSSRRGPLGRLLAGSTASRLMASARCPVAVAPAGYAEAAAPRLRRIGVAIDGSSDSICALRLAERIAARVKGRLGVVAVAPSGDEPEAPELTALLEELVASAPISARADSDIRFGDAAVELSDAGEHLDLLVCGSRGRGHARAALGRVSSALLQSAPCPVLVVPPLAARGESPPPLSGRAHQTA